MNTELMFSKQSDLWTTPLPFFQKYDDEFGFTIDGAADETNFIVPNGRFYGPGGLVEDALTADWTGERVWLNPPYSLCAAFLAKAAEEAKVHDVPSCVLIPARTDTKYFHNFVYCSTYHVWHPWIRRVDFIKGRLKFGSDRALNNSAPFPSIVVVTRGC